MAAGCGCYWMTGGRSVKVSGGRIPDSPRVLQSFASRPGNCERTMDSEEASRTILDLAIDESLSLSDDETTTPSYVAVLVFNDDDSTVTWTKNSC